MLVRDVRSTCDGGVLRARLVLGYQEHRWGLGY